MIKSTVISAYIVTLIVGATLIIVGVLTNEPVPLSAGASLVTVAVSTSVLTRNYRNKRRYGNRVQKDASTKEREYK